MWLNLRTFFTLTAISQTMWKKCANNYPELYPLKEKMLKRVFGTFLGRLDPKWKTFWDYATFTISHFAVFLFKPIYSVLIWFDIGIRHTFYIYDFILPYLQVNLDSFVSSPKATCNLNIFTASGRELYAPHTGNKNIINGRFQGRGNTLNFKKTNMRPRQKLSLILLKRNILH